MLFATVLMKSKYIVAITILCLIPIISTCKKTDTTNKIDNKNKQHPIKTLIQENINNTTSTKKTVTNNKQNNNKTNIITNNNTQKEVKPVKDNKPFNPYPNPWWTKAKYYSPCFRYVNTVATQFTSVYGDEYPWWFNIGQLYAETGCRWEMSSSDGWGSVGPAQITPAFEGRFMRSLGLYHWETDFAQYFYGYARLMMRYLNETNKLCYTGPTIQKRMWAWFQVYNTGPGGVVNAAITRAGVCNHDIAWKHCHGRWICVWKTRSGCRQWRNACDINFKYSETIYNYGLKYKQPYKTDWLFW